MKNHPQILIAALVLKFLSWSPATAAPLPCLESSPSCIEQLTEAAIANSAELDAIDQRLAVAAEQQRLLGERADQHRARSWTTWLTMDPVALIGNLFGGGPAQELELKVEELELRGMSVEAAAANLEVRRGEVEDRLREEVLNLILGYEEAARKIAGLRSRIETEAASYQIQVERLTRQLEAIQTQIQIAEVGYRFGQGSTREMIGLWERPQELQQQLDQLETSHSSRTLELEQQIAELEIEQTQSVRKLLEMTGYELEAHTQQAPADRWFDFGGDGHLEHTIF